MSDFLQNKTFSTLHNLRLRSDEDLETKLIKYSQSNPICLALPCLHTELYGQALTHILKELSSVGYLREIIIGLDQADYGEYLDACEFFRCLPQSVKILWLNNPALIQLEQNFFGESGYAPGGGKGRNAWYCSGYFLASNRSKALVFHDCDITTYSRNLLTRLVYPIVAPQLQYSFSKGYYYRANQEKLNGRVTRLFLIPLIFSLQKLFPNNEFLNYLSCFRYPLAGEYTIDSKIIKNLRIPGDWGLEVGILAEVFYSIPYNQICQVDIADKYDHRHHPVSQSQTDTGLAVMTSDIAKTIFTYLSTNGLAFSRETFQSMSSSYHHLALDLIDKYQADADFNGLPYDQEEEKEMIGVFAKTIYQSGKEFLEKGIRDIAFFPCWEQVMAISKNFLPNLYEIVEQDNQMNHQYANSVG